METRLTLSALSIFRLFFKWLYNFPSFSKTSEIIAITFHTPINKTMLNILQKVSCKSVQCFLSSSHFEESGEQTDRASTCTCVGWKVLTPSRLQPKDFGSGPPTISAYHWRRGWPKIMHTTIIIPPPFSKYVSKHTHFHWQTRMHVLSRATWARVGMAEPRIAKCWQLWLCSFIVFRSHLSIFSFARKKHEVECKMATMPSQPAATSKAISSWNIHVAGHRELILRRIQFIRSGGHIIALLALCTGKNWHLESARWPEVDRPPQKSLLKHKLRFPPSKRRTVNKSRMHSSTDFLRYLHAQAKLKVGLDFNKNSPRKSRTRAAVDTMLPPLLNIRHKHIWRHSRRSAVTCTPSRACFPG